MRNNKPFATSFRTLRHFLGMLLLAASGVQAQDPILLDIRGGVEVWSVPQPPPLDGFGATKILFRTTAPEAKIVTIEGIAIDGELVQQFLPSRGRAIPTPLIDSQMPDMWRAADSSSQHSSRYDGQQSFHLY